MKSKNSAGRPRQRTARTSNAWPGTPAFYADSLANKMLDGFVSLICVRPYHVGAFGTIETEVEQAPDRPVVFDVRHVIGSPRRVARHDSRDRCVVELSLAYGRTIHVGLDVPCEALKAAMRKAGI